MTCEEIADFLLDYVENNLPALVRDRFEEHLQICPDCVYYLDTYRDTIRLGRLACQEDFLTLVDLPEELLHAILDAASPSER